jgi:hypothetical protein
MWKAGQLPVPADQLPTGTIIIKEIKARLMRSDSTPEFVRRSKEKIWKHN